MTKNELMNIIDAMKKELFKAPHAILHGFKYWRIYSSRSTRSEFWWWVLYMWLMSVLATDIDNNIFYFFFLLALIPAPAVWVRRVHDSGNRIGKCFIPLVGGWFNIYFLCKGTDQNETRWKRPEESLIKWKSFELFIAKGYLYLRRGKKMTSDSQPEKKELFKVPKKYHSLIAQLTLVAFTFNAFKTFFTPQASGGSGAACGSLFRPVIGQGFDTHIGWIWDYGDSLCGRMMNGRLWEFFLSVFVVLICAASLRKIEVNTKTEPN